MSVRKQVLPEILATDPVKAERIADPDEVIHRSQRQTHADMEVNLLAPEVTICMEAADRLRRPALSKVDSE
jgi:hypothetical protein